MSNPRVITKVKVSRLSKEPKLNPIFTKALLKDPQNLGGVTLWKKIGIYLKASIKKAILLKVIPGLTKVIILGKVSV